MTNREEELLRWIREDPLISQQALAERAGIARSSVAVHISNLMRKGKIVGRGYVLAEEGYVAVVGAANVDIGGVSSAPLLSGDSNPGRVSVALGGVGRNIAENLARLGLRVRLITALGEDEYAERLRQNCRALGVDLGHSLTVPGARTSTYLAVSDCDGELRAAVNDMAIYEALTPAFLQTKLEALNRARLVVLDANLPRESVDFLARRLTVPLVADPVSVKKAERLAGALDRLALMKPNRREASLLSGVEIGGDDDLPRAARALLRRGVRNVCISLGSAGVYWHDGRADGILPCYPAPVVNTNGCGDAFLAGAAAGMLEGKNLAEMARMGLAAASVCARAESAVSPALDRETIEKIIQAEEESHL